MQLVLERLPGTLYLALVATLLILPLGIGLGMVAAFRRGSLVDRVVNVLSIASVSVVDFWLALMLILVFAVGLDVLPTSGYGGIEYVILPAVTLALLSAGTLAQVTRASTVEQLNRNYVAAARARGIPERQVIMRHALRNAAIPIVTVSGGIIATLLGGAIVAEVVFGWAGVGLLFVQAIQRRDLPLIEAAVFLTAVTVTLLNLFTDVLYQWLDPRVRLT
jgi:peptide/nickel transport system permease protein